MRRRLGELLVEAGFLSPRDLEAGLASQSLTGGTVGASGRRKLGQILVDAGMITDAQLTQTLGQQLSVPFVSLKHVDFSAALLAKVPAELAQAFTLLPVFLRSTKNPTTKKQADTLYVAMEDPTNQEALLEVSMRAGLPVKPMIASPADLHRSIRAFYFGEVGEPEPAHEVTIHERSAEAVRRRQGAQTVPGHRAVVVPPKPPPPKIALSNAPPPVHAISTPPQPPPPREVHAPPAAPSPAAPPSPSPRSSRDDDEAPEIEVSEIEIPLRGSDRAASPDKSGNITLLDGTSVALPRRTRASERPPGAPEVSVSHAATRELLMRLRVEGGDTGKVIATLVQLLIARGLISESDLHAELKKLS